MTNQNNQIIKDLPAGQIKSRPLDKGNSPFIGGIGGIGGVAPVAPVAPTPPGTCFPAGVKVLMANGSIKNIEDIKTGDMLMTFGGEETKCLDVELTILGNRKMVEFEDKSFMWSEEHSFWTRDIHTKQQWWWSFNPESWIKEIESGFFAGLKDNHSIFTGEDVEYAHIDGWKSIKAKVTDEVYDYFTPLYFPKTDGHPVIINGYVVGGGADEWSVDYTKVNWTGLVKSKELETV